MRRMLRKSLLAKLLVSHAIVIVVTLLGVSLLSTRLFGEYHFSLRERELFAMGEEIADSIAHHKAIDESFLGIMDRFLGARIVVVDPEGYVVASTSAKVPRGGRVHGDPRAPDLPLSQSFGEPMLSVSVPIVSSGENTGGLILSSPVTGLNESVDALKRLMLYAAAGAIVLSTLSAYALSRSISKPLQAMTQATAHMVSGDFSKRLSVSSEDEVGRLAERFNHMAAALEHTISDLAREKAKIESVLKSMSEGVIALREDGSIDLVNDRARHILNIPQQALGTPVADIQQGGALSHLVAQVVESGESGTIEFGHGETHLLAQATPLDEPGGMRRVVIVLQDITKNIQLDMIRTELLKDLSHELRTPISSIQVLAEALKDDVAGDEHSKKHYIDSVYEQAKRLAALVKDLLDLALLETSGRFSEAAATDVAQAAQKAVQTLDPGERRVTLRIEENIGFVLADEARLVQAISSLLDNALKYSPKESEVHLLVERAQTGVRVSVEDRGYGISEHDLPHIWERFYRADKSRARSSGGAGLGLSLVKRIAEFYGGSVSVTSKLQEGSVFSITLPSAPC